VRSVTPADIKAQARAAGFDLCGIAATAQPRLSRITDWVAAGRAGDMRYLFDSIDERLDPSRVLPSVRSIISLGVIYNTGAPYSIDAVPPDDRSQQRAAVARYAWGRDYHEVIRARLRALVAWLAEAAGPGLEAFSCVDSGPVQERVFAEAAGLGWIGKNTCVINPDLGSWIFLSEVLTNLDLAPDRPGVDQCGTCTRCLDACPTGAIKEPYVVDATRCLSYLTIETRGTVDASLRAEIRDRIYGCDICQDVCPWNRRAAVSDEPDWQPREGLEFPHLIDLCERSDDEWIRTLKGSAMRRAGLHRLRRSLAYAAASLPAASARRALDALALHRSAQDAGVADAIAWARQRL
jgi:epoxyqueuosine reductase